MRGETDKRGQVRCGPVVLNEAFRKANITIDEQTADCPPVMQNENGVDAFRCPRLFDGSAAGEGDAQPAAVNIVQQPGDEPSAEAHTAADAGVLHR